MPNHLLSVLILMLVSADLSAQAPKVIRRPLAEFDAAQPKGPGNGVHSAGLSPDGKLVACIRAGQLSVYALGEAKPLFTTEPDKLKSSEVAFSADGKLIAFHGKDKRIEILSARTGKAHASAELANTPESVDALTFSPDDRQLAVSSGFLYHKNLRIFDTTTGKELGAPLLDVDGMAYQLIYSADGKRLIANHYFIIYDVDAESHRLKTKIRAKAFSTFFQKEKLCAVQEESGEIHEVAGQEVGKAAIGKFMDKIDPFSATRMAIAGSPPLAAIPQGTEITVRITEGRELFRVIGEDSPIRRIRLSADGSVLLIFRDSLKVEVFRLE
jgi:hypothetical protein